MEILRSNFEEAFPEIRQSILEADFISVDTEFTGLSTQGSQFYNGDDIQTRYSKVKQIVDTYTIVQYGVCTFKETDKGYIVKPYNFYIYGDDTDSIQSRRSFSCSASSLSFLRQNGFDFNKLIDHGIPFYNFVEERSVFTYSSGVSVMQRQPSAYEPNLNKYSKIYLDNLKAKIQEWLQNGAQKPLLVQTNNSTQRRLVFQELQQGKYSGYLKGEARDTRNMEIHKIKDEDRFLKSTDSPLLNFRNVIESIKDSRCPVIIHNGMLDLCYTVDQFWHNLPEDVSDFKDLVKSMWGTVIDTKYFSEFHPLLKSCFTTTVLGSLFNTVEEELRKSGHIIKMADGFDRYTTTGSPERSHEAGYDAYMTGVIYLGFVNFIKEKEEENLEKQNKEKDVSLVDNSQISASNKPILENNVDMIEKNDGNNEKNERINEDQDQIEEKHMEIETSDSNKNDGDINATNDKKNEEKEVTNNNLGSDGVNNVDINQLEKPENNNNSTDDSKDNKSKNDSKPENDNESNNNDKSENNNIIQKDDNESDESDDQSDDDSNDESDSDSDEEGELSGQDNSIIQPKNNKFTENSFLSYYNKVFLMRSDIPYIDIRGSETQGGNIRKNRFYLQNIPSGVTHPAIERLYPEVGPIWINWVDEHSAWLTVKTISKIELMKTGILGIERVRPFLQNGTRYTEGIAYNIDRLAADIEVLTGEQWEVLQKSIKSQQQLSQNESSDVLNSQTQNNIEIQNNSDNNNSHSNNNETIYVAPQTLPTGGASYDDLDDIPIPASFLNKRKSEFSESENEHEPKKQKPM